MSNPDDVDPAAGLSIEQIIAQLDARIEVLKPLVREFNQLEAARAALVADYGVDAKRTRRGARPVASAPARGRRAPRGANREAILRLVGEQPGITVAEIAQATGIGKPTVHSTVYALTRRGELERAGDGVKLAGRRSEPTARAARRTARRAARASARRRAAARRAPARRAQAPTAPVEAAPSTPPAADAASEGSPAEAGTDASAE